MFSLLRFHNHYFLSDSYVFVLQFIFRCGSQAAWEQENTGSLSLLYEPKLLKLLHLVNFTCEGFDFMSNFYFDVNETWIENVCTRYIAYTVLVRRKIQLTHTSSHLAGCVQYKSNY